MAVHESLRTTKLYDRTKERVMQDEVERIKRSIRVTVTPRSRGRGHSGADARPTPIDGRYALPTVDDFRQLALQSSPVFDVIISLKTNLNQLRDSKIAPIRAILQWGVDNWKLAENPAARIVIDVRSKKTERIRGFTDEEAALILRHAAREKDPVRRWVPLLCAYSGARLSEVCQLRVEDVFRRGGVWCMKFDPEAGSLKNENSERGVPLYPAIVESGFTSRSIRKREDLDADHCHRRHSWDGREARKSARPNRRVVCGERQGRAAPVDLSRRLH